jgi:hypothetical protein
MPRHRFVLWMSQILVGSEPCAERDFFSLLPPYSSPD